MQKIKINDKRPQLIGKTILGIFVFILVLFISSIFTVHYKIAKEVVTQKTMATEEIEWLDEQYEGTIDLANIIQQNIQQQIKETIETQVVELEYETQYQNNPNLPKGKVQVLQQGQDGKQELIIKKQYSADELIVDEQIGRKVITAAVDRIVEVGTSAYYDTHKIKVGDTVYATPYELAIRMEPKKEAEVNLKVNQNAKLVIEKKKGSWYYVRHGENGYGWVESDCVTYLVPNQTNYNNSNVTYSKAQLLAKLSKNMQLNQPSGCTLEQFEKIFANESKDKNGIFKENAKYFYYIEQSYGINGIFVAAIGIHESNWGQSKIATNKKNLFGYGAYDKSAYSSAYSYNGYAASIDMIARVLVKNYLNPKGTSIYNGEVATGKYYHGATLAGVNTKYATDKNWANSVYTWMKYLYNRL